MRAEKLPKLYQRQIWNNQWFDRPAHLAIEVFVRRFGVLSGSLFRWERAIELHLIGVIDRDQDEHQAPNALNA